MHSFKPMHPTVLHFEVSRREITGPCDPLTLIHESATHMSFIESVVPLTLHCFLRIRPISNGNGRMSHLLTLKLLYIFDYIVGRHINQGRLLKGTKEDYYQTLEASTQGSRATRRKAGAVKATGCEWESKGAASNFLFLKSKHPARA